jgi:hypothetical protein
MVNLQRTPARRLAQRLALAAAVLTIAEPARAASAERPQTPSQTAGALPPGPSTIAGVTVEYPIAVQGTVVDRRGRPIAGVTVELVDFAVAGAKARVVTGVDGRFAFAHLARRSLLLRVRRPSHYTELVPLDLQRPARVHTVDAGPVVLTARAPGRARLMFVGDTMLGRRLADSDEDGVEGEPGDLIRPGSRADDAERVLRFVRDVLASADYTVANLECVVTDRPETPHPFKPYTLHSHPDTLIGLVRAGVDAVSSGNNHVFDFLDPGVGDTLRFVAAAGLDGAGAEMNETRAREAVIARSLNGVELALQGLSAMRFDGADVQQYHLVARDPAKAGALHASPDNLAHFLAGSAGAFAAPMLHGGDEYSRHPSAEMRALFVAAIAGGAGLVVAHHPHVLQGIGVVDGPDGPRFVLMSLGNFLFDHTTHDTVDSVIAVVDVDALPGGGYHVPRVELIPVRLDGYVPRLLAGEGVARLGRHLGHLSTTLPARPPDARAPDGLRGAVVFAARHRVIALADPAQLAVTESAESLRLQLLGRATPPIPFARRGPADSLARVDVPVAATIDLGRDVLEHGDFEDLDVDGEVGEAFGWITGPSAFTQGRAVRNGVRAAVLRRAAAEAGTSSLITFRRVPIAGGARLTIRGHLRGEAAGEVTVRVRFFDATEQIAEEIVHTQPAGSYDWTRFLVTVTAPAQATGLHLSFRQGPPGGATGLAFLDDVSVIQWERSVAPGEPIPTPNAWGFFRLHDVAHNVTRLEARVTHRSYAEG